MAGGGTAGVLQQPRGYCWRPTHTSLALQEALGGAATHCTRSGVAHGAFDNDLEALAAARELLSYLPLSNRERPPQVSAATGKQGGGAAGRRPKEAHMPARVLAYQPAAHPLAS